MPSDLVERIRYGAIMADPPWTFSTYSEKGKDRSAEQHYAVMDYRAIAELPVKDLAADNCCLFLWVTDPMLPKGFDLIKAWGFTFKTVAFYWVKTNKNNDGFFTGQGYWTRANPEQCLLATRGKPKRIEKNVARLMIEKRREHSRKPDETRKRVMRLVPGPYIELFARETADGWDSWGNEVGLFDSGPVDTRRVGPDERKRLLRKSLGLVDPPESTPLFASRQA